MPSSMTPWASSGYDAHGNMTSFTPPGRPSHRLEYSSVDLPITYTPPATQGSPTPQRTFYDPDRRIAGMGAEGTSGLTNLHDSTGRLVEQRLENDIRFYTYHPQGALASIAAADVTVSHSFDGALPTRTEWSGTVSGQVVRGYDPSTGRWNSRDPLLLAGGSPNLYAYALNDPVNCLDPLGLGPAMQAAQHLAGQQPQLADLELHPSPFVSIPAAWQEYTATCNQWLHNQAPGYEIVHDGANFVANCFTAVPGVGHFANYAFTLADHGSTAVFNQLATDYYVGPSVNTQAVEDAYNRPGAFGLK